MGGRAPRSERAGTLVPYAALFRSELPVEARKRIFYLDLADNFAGGKEDTRMINLMFEFFTSTMFVWNDSLQDKLTIRSYDEEGHHVWLINPGLLDWRSVVVLDQWTPLTYSGMVSMGLDLAVSIADVEKVNREKY